MIFKSKLVSAILLALLVPYVAQAQPAAADVVLSTAARLRGQVASLPESVLPAADREALNEQLSVAEDAARAGHVPVALHRLSRVWRITVAQMTRVATEAQQKEGIPALERYWKEADAERKRRLARGRRREFGPFGGGTCACGSSHV